jgi:hypothetical protein
MTGSLLDSIGTVGVRRYVMNSAMQIELTEQELDVLREVMTRERGDVKEEIYKTDTPDYKALLKTREAAIISILTKLEGLTARTA